MATWLPQGIVVAELMFVCRELRAGPILPAEGEAFDLDAVFGNAARDRAFVNRACPDN